MTRKSLMWLTLAVLLAPAFSVQADTFKNKKTGEVFYGFRTQKKTAQKTLIYNEAEKKFIPMDLSEYEVSLDQKGRHNSVILVPVTKPEIMLSEAVSKTVAEAIIRASNTGPRFVLVQIDSPGGRGMYMQTICQAITQTDNCPVVAYISGGAFGGAHSTAAVVALACARIYIAPTASVSAISPYVGAGRTAGQQSEYLDMYSSYSLASFSVYAESLAGQNKRPGLLAKALLDKRISIVEVMDIDGNKGLVEKANRSPAQTIIRTLTEGMAEPTPVPSSQDKPSSSAGAEATVIADIYSRVLTLTSTDALNFKLADSLAGAVSDVLADMKTSDAQIATAPGIDEIIQKFIAGRRNLAQSLARIEFLEDRTSTLETQLNDVEKQIRTSTVTRRVSRSNSQYQRGRINLPRGYQNYYPDVRLENPPAGDNTDIYGNRLGIDTRSRRRRDAGERETIESTEPSTNVDFIRAELSDVLRGLIAEYQKTIGLANRWVGALPPEITIQALQKNMESAMALADNLQMRR